MVEIASKPALPLAGRGRDPPGEGPSPASHALGDLSLKGKVGTSKQDRLAAVDQND